MSKTAPFERREGCGTHSKCRATALRGLAKSPYADSASGAPVNLTRIGSWLTKRTWN